MYEYKKEPRSKKKNIQGAKQVRNILLYYDMALEKWNTAFKWRLNEIFDFIFLDLKTFFNKIW